MILFNPIESQTWWNNSWINHFAKSWNNSKVKSNLEIATQKQKRIFFLPNRYFNHDLLEPKANVLPMSYTERLATLTPLHAYSLTDIKTKTLKNYKNYSFLKICSQQVLCFFELQVANGQWALTFNCQSEGMKKTQVDF